MAKNKNRQREPVSEKIPLVSVIIPMYNSAKFIPQTLESLLYQTMKDFEVVVVDDCSTDNSVEVVENCAEKFGGRLHVIRLPKNTGTPSLPRNVGIQFARGKYISFLDSDDLYTKTALEELSELAEEYQADVVSIDGSFKLWGGERKSIDDPAMTNMNELTNPNNFKIMRFLYDTSLIKPTLTPDIEERLKLWIKAPGYDYGIFSSFCRRDFLLLNQIYFHKIPAGEDHFFNFVCLCMSKNFLRVPTIFYIVRPRDNSIMREELSNSKSYFIKRVSSFKIVMTLAGKFMENIPFFQTHPFYKYAVLDKFASFRLPPTINFYAHISRLVLHPLVEEEFKNMDVNLSAYIFDVMNIYRIQIMKLQQEINALKNPK